MNAVRSQSSSRRILEGSENGACNSRSLAALILAGGNGTRLTSLARTITGENTPKQFCPLLGKETLLEQTRKRVALIVPPTSTATVLTREHERFYKRIVDPSNPDVVIQPDNRGTAPAILYGLLRLISLGFKASVAIFPCDHYVSDDEKFMRHVQIAYESTQVNPQKFVLLGIRSTGPETQYGWIEPTQAIDFSRSDCDRVMPVRRFWEKPPAALALQLWRRNCLWNSFVVVASIGSLLDLYARTLPELYVSLAQLLPVLGTDGEPSAIASAYAGIASSGFSDSILADDAEQLYVLPVSGLEWSDLGEPTRALATIGKLSSPPAWIHTL